MVFVVYQFLPSFENVENLENIQNLENKSETKQGITWKELPVQTFDSETEARTFILQQTIESNQTFHNLQRKIYDEIDQLRFLVDFCFDDVRYIVHRQLFIGKIPDALKIHVKNAQIQVHSHF